MTRLTADELKMARALGDRNALWLEAESSIRHIMRDLKCDDEDALQAVRLAVGEAVDRWDPARGAFSTFISARARGAARDWMRQRNNAIRTISLNEPAEEGENLTRLELLTYDGLDQSTPFEKMLARLDVDGELNAKLRRLSNEDAEFIREVLRLGGQRAYGRIYHQTPMVVSRQFRKIVLYLSLQRRESSDIGTVGAGFSGMSPSDPDRFVGVGLGNPYGDWSYKPTAADLAAGAAPRDDGFKWSDGARKILGLTARSELERIRRQRRQRFKGRNS